MTEVFKKPAGSTDWATPPHIVRIVHKFFDGPPDLDPCDGPLHAIGAKISIMPPKDGRLIPWKARSGKVLTVWVNSPFGRELPPWVEKCATVGDEASVLQIMPAAIETRHWQDVAFKKAKAVCFLKGRTKFIPPAGVKSSQPPMGCAIVGWGNIDTTRFWNIFSEIGFVAGRRG